VDRYLTMVVSASGKHAAQSADEAKM